LVGELNFTGNWERKKSEGKSALSFIKLETRSRGVRRNPYLDMTVRLGRGGSGGQVGVRVQGEDQILERASLETKASLEEDPASKKKDSIS